MAQPPEDQALSKRAPSSTGGRYRDDHDDTIDDFCGISIHAAISTLLYNEKFSDMIILCDGREFKAHRAIVCTQSSFFDKALSNNLKEATDRVIELPEDDPDILERFLEFLYTGTYSDGVKSTWGRPSDVAMMDPETVQRNLQDPAGVEQESIPDNNPSTFIQEGDETEQVGQDPDPDYNPPDEEEDPDEEYNEYYGENPWDSNEEAADGQDELAKRMEDLSQLPKAEGIQQLADIRDEIELPLRLYVMADKYDVPALRLLARDRFYRAIELAWEQAECFPDIVDELYQTTPPTDTAMREIVCRLVGTRLLDVQVRDKMRPVMAKHGDFAVGVLEYAIHLGTLP
ncbi:hypothetical protein FSARC_8408 [Fusarium sarcochroum]|uniref:BTB domain-containing protein n=1 Tax=Fusarium sarcochroum TaxID=1208366 RepID=A0A8H4TTD2_9HYPO|nr:hypothetical protein FSARC_8408 [Fusarium sarcochroum]